MCPLYEILWFLSLSVCLMSWASWITVTLDITDGQVFIFETHGTAPLLSEPLIWVSPRQVKVRCEIWILTIPVWENQEKEFPAESGRRGSVVLVPTRRKGQSQQFSKGPAFTMTSTDMETNASLLLNRALFLAPTRCHRLSRWTIWLSRQVEALVTVLWRGSRGLCNYARSLKLQDSYLDMFCGQQFGGAVIFQF